MENRTYNKRQHKRVAIELTMSLVVFDAASAGLIPGAEMIKLRSAEINDMSADDIRIHTYDLEDDWISYLTNGTVLLALRFHLPGCSVPLNPIGQVVWIKVAERYKYVLGVRFASIKKGDRESIAQFVASREPSG